MGFWWLVAWFVALTSKTPFLTRLRPCFCRYLYMVDCKWRIRLQVFYTLSWLTGLRTFEWGWAKMGCGDTSSIEPTALRKEMEWMSLGLISLLPVCYLCVCFYKIRIIFYILFSLCKTLRMFLEVTKCSPRGYFSSYTQIYINNSIVILLCCFSLAIINNAIVNILVSVYIWWFDEIPRSGFLGCVPQHFISFW